jgi:hypothetical protein
VNRLARSAAIGAAACSYRAAFYRQWDVFLVLAAAGALAGCLYSVLEPAVRRHPRLRYLPWVLCAYLVIFGGVGVGGLIEHDQHSLQIVANPWLIGFILVVAPIGAYAAARTFEDK